MMLDPLLMEDDLSPDHHRAILVSLLAQGQPALALKYTRIRRPPVITAEDVSLHIAVLLSNGAIQVGNFYSQGVLEKLKLTEA